MAEASPEAEVPPRSPRALRVAEFLIRSRIAVLVLFLVLSALALRGVPRVGFELGVGTLFESNAEERAKVEDYHRKVPARGMVGAVTLEFDRTVGEAEVEIARRLARELEESGACPKTVCAMDVLLFEKVGPLPVPRPLGWFLHERDLDQLADRHPLLRGNFVSKDGRSTAVLLIGPPHAPEAVAEHLRVHPPEGASFRVHGPGRVESAMIRWMRRDLVRTVLLELVGFALLLPWIFRSVRGTLLPLLSVGVSLLLCAGLLGAFGGRITVLDVAVPGLVLVIGLTDTIHFLHRFEEEYLRLHDRRAALVRTLRTVSVACANTSLTTMVGFGSLVLSGHRAVQEFGAKACVAVALTFVTVILLLPSLLAVWPVRRPAPHRTLLGPRLLFPPRRLVLLATVLVVAATALGLARCEVDAHWTEELPARDPAVQDLAWFEEHFGALLTFDVHVSGPLDDPEVLSALAGLRETLLEEPGIAGVESYLEWTEEVLGNEGPLDAEGWRRAAAVLPLVHQAFPDWLLDPAMREGRFLFRTEDIGTKRFLALAEEVEALSATLPKGARARAAGYSRMAHEGSRLVVTTLLQSLVLSSGGIALVLVLLLRSIRLGLVSMVPNLLPVATTFAITGWLGIDLRIGITMIFAVGLGLAVDDTIHLVTRFQQARATGLGATTAMRQSLLHTGNAMATTTCVLALGCLCYLPSGFRSLRDTGILMTTLVGSALLADLYLLPLLLVRRGASNEEGSPASELPQEPVR